MTGLNIIIPPEGTDVSDGTKSKLKAKTRTEGVEILAAADLRLKAGRHYALLGRNGSGKSSAAPNGERSCQN